MFPAEGAVHVEYSHFGDKKKKKALVSTLLGFFSFSFFGFCF
jgi:hypothetical protein